MSPGVPAAVIAAGASDGRPGKKSRVKRQLGRQVARAARLGNWRPGSGGRGFFRDPLLRWPLDGGAVWCRRSACRCVAQTLPTVSVIGIASHDPLRILADVRKCAKATRSRVPNSCGTICAGCTLGGGNRLGFSGIAVQSINDETQITSFRNCVGDCARRVSASWS